MRPSIGNLPLLLAAWMLAACQEPAVGVRLRFPSEQTFLITNTVTVDIYDGTGTGERSPDAICRALSVQSAVAPGGVQPLKSSRNTPACSFLDGGVEFTGIDVGRRVVFAEAVSFDSTVILRGCTVADLTTTPSADPAAAELGTQSLVDVQLATLPSYPDNVQPLCEDVVEKCAENKPCVEN